MAPEALGVGYLAGIFLLMVVVGAAFLGLAVYRRDYPVGIPSVIADRMKIAAVGFVVFVTVPAMLAPHTHSHPTTDLAETTHDHGSSVSPGS